MRKILIFAILVYGFSAIVTQIILMRELIVASYGNELVVGIILGNWLILVALGSWLFGRLADRFKISLGGFVLSQVLVALILPLQIWFIRLTKNVGPIPGELPPLSTIFWICSAALAPGCIIFGLQFSLGCRIFTAQLDVPKSEITSAAIRIGEVYIYEGLGSILGGLFFSYLLVRLLNSFQIAFLIGTLNFIGAALLLMARGLQTNISIGIGFVVIFLVYLFFGLGKVNEIQKLALKAQWHSLNLVESTDSIYGNLAVSKNDGEYSFFENGLLMFTTKAYMTNEERVHFRLLEHPKPRKVLIIGGGVGGALKEIWKHKCEKVVYVELDPVVIKTARKYIPKEDKAALERSQVYTNIDGRLFVKRAKDNFDVIIIDLPDPSTALLNRFYTLEFFKEIKKILSPDGLVSVGISASETYMGPELKALNGSIYRTLKEVFPDCIVIPGDTYYYLASPAKNMLTYDPRVLIERMKRRQLQVRSITDYLIRYKLFPFRVSYALKSLKEAEGAKLNTDFRPISYYHTMLVWTAMFSPKAKKAFSFLSNINKYWLIGAFIPLVLMLILATRKSKRFRKLPIPIALMTTGFAGMVLEIVLIFAFQVLYGYAYYKIGMIVTSFMIGLVIGSYLMNKILETFCSRTLYGCETKGFAGIKPAPTFIFALIIFATIIYALLVPFILVWLPALTGGTSLFLAVQIIFPILVIIPGFLVGANFPLANQLYLETTEKVSQTAGMLYGADLLGACLGAFFASVILLPLIGILPLCLVVAVINAGSLILLAFSQYPIA